MDAHFSIECEAIGSVISEYYSYVNIFIDTSSKS